MIRVYPWCTNCGKVATLQRNTMCIRCVAHLEAIVFPIERHIPMRAPALLRFLRWLGGTR